MKTTLMELYVKNNSVMGSVAFGCARMVVNPK